MSPNEVPRPGRGTVNSILSTSFVRLGRTMKQADAVVILSRAVDALDAMRDKIRSDGGRTRRPQSLAVYEAFVGRLVEETKSGYAALLKRLFARRDANASGDGPLAAKQCRAVLRDFLAQLPRLAADSISSVARAAVSQLAELVSDGSIEDGNLYIFFFLSEVLLLLCSSLLNMHGASVTSLASGAVHLEVLDD